MFQGQGSTVQASDPVAQSQICFYESSYVLYLQEWLQSLLADKILSLAVFLSLCLEAQDRWEVEGTCMAQSCGAKIVAEPA